MNRNLSSRRVRILLALPVAALLLWAWSETSALKVFGQAARSYSLAGQEDLTFWVNHDGLIDMHLEGEVGYGDLARFLIRRRSNAPLLQKIRDRFTFPERDLKKIQTPDLFRAAVSDSGIAWENQPERFVIGQSRILNLPIVVENRTASAVHVKADFLPSSGFEQLRSTFDPVELKAGETSAFFVEVLETSPGQKAGRLTLESNGRKVNTELNLDVRPLAKLRVHLEEEDGSPAIARIYLTGSDGLAYTPLGAISRITAMSAEYYFHAENSFEVELPAGSTLIEATRGLEYELTSKQIELAGGKTQDVTLRLKRWENMAKQGWYSSDAHIHANYTSPHHQNVSPQDARLQAFGEDLNNANMMVANSSASFLHDLHQFEGKPNALSGPNHILYWNEEMRNNGPYGHMCLYGLKKLAEPLYTGFAGTPYWEDYPPNYTLAKDTQQQGGAVTYAHPFSAGDPKTDTAHNDSIGRLYDPSTTVNFENAGVKELPVDLALGQIDAMDVFSNSDEVGSMGIWYRLLNSGFRLSVSAGSDSFTNVVDHYAPGGGRVYVHSGGRLNYDEWVKAYKQGRSFGSNGPMLFFTVNGKEPGEEIKLGSKGSVKISAKVHTKMPVDKVEVIANGKVVATRDMPGRNEISFEEEIQLEGSAWLALRAYGPWHRLVLNDLQTIAHTSPVYVNVGGKPIASREDLRFYIDWIEKLIVMTRERGHFANDARRQEVLDLFARGLDEFKQREKTAD